MRGRRIVVSLASLTLAGVLFGASPAGANAETNKPERGCPPNYTLTPNEEAGDPTVVAAIDKNNDGQVCVKTVPVGTENKNSGNNTIDNSSNSQNG